MKCPTCGEAELELKKGDKLFRGHIIADCEWRECPKCGEKVHKAAEVKRQEQEWHRLRREAID